MPYITLRPGDWTPDKGDVNHEGLFQVMDVVPYGGGWVPTPTSMEEICPVATCATALRGIHIHGEIASGGTGISTWRVFAGNSTRLLRSTASRDFTLESASATVHTSVAGFSGWQFCSYADEVWAASQQNHLQYAAATATNFADAVLYATPTTYRPKARFVSTINSSILIANVTHGNTAGPFTSGNEDQSLVMWSAPANHRRFGDLNYINIAETIGSGYQRLDDEHGAITAITGGEFAIIFKASAIYRMDGPPYTFRPIATGIGTIFPNSVARHGDDVYFISNSGCPMVIRGGDGLPVPLGKGTVNRTVATTTTSNYWADQSEYFNEVFSDDSVTQPWTAIDGASGIVVFGVSRNANSTELLFYNSDEDRFGFSGGQETNISTGLRYPLTTTGPKIQYAKSHSLVRIAPPVVNGTAEVPSSLLGDLVCVDNRERSSDKASLLMFKDTITTGGATYRSTAEPYFRWPYIKFYPDGASKFSSSRIVRVRPIYSCAEFSSDTDSTAAERQLKTVVIVRTKSRFPGENHSVTATYDPYVDTYQDDNGWITIDPSVLGTHHSISIQFFDPSGSGATTPLTSLMRSMLDLEVEYVIEGPYGSAYRT